MPGLLVSVRSSTEARAALEGGADLIDIKEPSNGPLGRADRSVWREVVDTVAQRRPVSIALGELHELDSQTPITAPGISFRKLGFAGAASNWRSGWANVRERDSSVPWVAVIYADWQVCEAPSPEEVLREAASLPSCRGVLIDTYFKNRPSPVGLDWRDRVDAIREAGLISVLAGGLGLARIDQLAALNPDFFAVRGAACNGPRDASICTMKVAELAECVHRLG